jgi:bla regulator protein blaR1
MGGMKSALVLTLLLQCLRAQPARFEVASIKRNTSSELPMRIGPIGRGSFMATNITLRELITMAYGLRDFQLSGAPGWLASERYDVSAKAATRAGREELTTMLQPLLEDRLRLKFHRESKEMPVYALTVAKPGKLMAAEGECGPDDPLRGPCGFLFILPGHLMGQKAAISRLVDALSRLTDRVVVDRTGLAGAYDIKLQYTPDVAPPPGAGDGPGMPTLPPVDPNGPSLFTALQEQLGLKLESQKGAVSILIIDHVDRPAGN